MVVPVHQAKAELSRTPGHPVRIRVLQLLQEGPRAVYEASGEIEGELLQLRSMVEIR